MHRARVAAAAAVVCLMFAVPGASQPPEQPAPPPFRLVPIGFAQVDFRGFPGWSETPGTGDLNRERIELRRLRVGVEGRWQRLAWELSVEPLDGDAFLKDAYLDVRLHRSFRVRGGHFKVPNSRDQLTPARQLDFMERTALAGSIAASRDVGAMVIGSAGGQVSYRAGVFAGDGSWSDSRAGLTSAARVIWEPGKRLEIAGSYTDGTLRIAPQGEQNGLDGRAPSGYRFFDEVYVHGRRRRLGIDAAWNTRRWRVALEAMRARDERRSQGAAGDDLPAVVGAGWSASAIRRFGVRKNAPDRQWQIGLRYDYLGFDDQGPVTGEDSPRSRASDLRARAAHTVTAGGSWAATAWLRFLGNAGIERYSELRSAPDAGQRYYATATARLQVQLP